MSHLVSGRKAGRSFVRCTSFPSFMHVRKPCNHGHGRPDCCNIVGQVFEDLFVSCSHIAAIRVLGPPIFGVLRLFLSLSGSVETVNPIHQAAMLDLAAQQRGCQAPARMVASCSYDLGGKQQQQSWRIHWLKWQSRPRPKQRLGAGTSGTYNRRLSICSAATQELKRVEDQHSTVPILSGGGGGVFFFWQLGEQNVLYAAQQA